jgi:hypothetical protein
MESEQTKEFNERLGQWIESQGFWFQLRYGMSGTGTGFNKAAFHLLNLLFRLGIVVFIFAICGAIYLMRNKGTAEYREGLSTSLNHGLSSTGTELSNFSYNYGTFSINKITSRGGERTFFTRLDARSIRGKMGFTDSFMRQWNLGVVSISKLDLELNAGADDTQSAQSISEAIFKQSSEVLINSIDISEANLHWGYSDRTFGFIEKSHLNVQRQSNAVKLSFKGGTFTQNWLRNLQIVEMIINCTPEGFTFEKASLRQGDATVDFSGLKVMGGARPTVSGKAIIRKLSLDKILPVAASAYVEGSFSGDFEVSGSSNSSEGIALAGEVTCDGLETISLRDKLPIIKALSDVDYLRNYNRIDLKSGSFFLKTVSGELTISRLKMRSFDEIAMEGELHVRPPTPLEAQEASRRNETGKAGAMPMATKKDDILLSLAIAAQQAKLAKKAKSGDFKSTDLSEEAVDIHAKRELVEQASERDFKLMRYDGHFHAFELAPRLLEKFPIDPAIGKIPFNIPLQGELFELSAVQAREVYQMRSKEL